MTFRTIEDVKAASTKELVDAYNSLSDSPIVKFRDRETAERRVWEMVQAITKPIHNLSKTNFPPSNVPSKTHAPVKVVVGKDKPTAAITTEASTKREEYNSRLIHMLVTENPKREGSRAHKKFGILLKFDGKTIGEYLAQEGKHPELDTEKGWPSTEIRYSINLNLMKAPAKNSNNKAA